MGTLTLVGTRLAEVGREFVYHGEAPGCEGCPYREQCLNLVDGGRYRITSVRDGAQVLECAIHEGGVRAVEVEPASVRANVPDKVAYAGNKTSLAGPCPYTECPSHQYCVPLGLEMDAEYRIAHIVGEPPHETCYLERDLTLVEFSPPTE